MPIIGIMASAISGNLWQPAGAYDSLATVTLSATTATISFAGIPSGYKHLQLRIVNRGTTAATEGAMLAKFNGDATATNYRYHRLNGNGVSTGTDTNSNANIGEYTGTGSGFATNIIDILDYTNTSKNKTSRTLFGIDQNGSGFVGMFSHLWMNTSAITSIDLTLNSGSFAANSSFALYGVK